MENPAQKWGTLGIGGDRHEDLVPIILSAASDLCKSFFVITESSC